MYIVVLACTHFPLVEADLAAASPRPLTFMDGGEGIARRIAHLTKEQSWPLHCVSGTAVFTRLGPDIEELQPALTDFGLTANTRSEEHTSELQTPMRISYSVFSFKKQKQH